MEVVEAFTAVVAISAEVILGVTMAGMEEATDGAAAVDTGGAGMVTVGMEVRIGMEADPTGMKTGHIGGVTAGVTDITTNMSSEVQERATCHVP